MFVIVWQFEVMPEHIAEFEQQYGPSGAWAQLFAKSTGYLGTRLLRDTERPHQYVTFDCWESEAEFQAFKDRFSQEYQALDGTLERLPLTETRLGTFSSTIDST
jgi:heme-degrading monooxygenase HmoA